MYYSPLRYPGGKNKLAKFIAKICLDNDVSKTYIEPYAGGSSVALFLLMEKIVENIIINDKDIAIYSFWHSVLNNSDNLCSLIDSTDTTVENWKKQRAIQENPASHSQLELGFSTLFMNRTNISGIIKGGIIGGINQAGNYKMDCRFNKPNIIERIERIAAKKDSITLLNMDAIDLINSIKNISNPVNSLIYFDPPYYNKGSLLYLHHYYHNDHRSISEQISKIKKINWIVSYDNTKEILQLYSKFKRKEYSFKHTAHRPKIGNEVLFFSNALKLPKGDWMPFDFNKSYKSLLLAKKMARNQNQNLL